MLLFRISILKNWQDQLYARQFNFKRIPMTLKINIVFEIFQIPFLYFKEQSAQRKFEINICLAPKWADLF